MHFSQTRPFCFLAAFWALAFGWAGVTAEEPKIPGIMLPQLTKITPEIVSNITSACPDTPLAKPSSPGTC